MHLLRWRILGPQTYKAPTLGSEEKDLIDKHGSFTLELPQEPCLHHVSS
jgi:hypothetical protein